MEAQVRLCELIASLSLATDLGMGQPMDHALRTCLLSVGIAQQMGLDGQALQNTYYFPLLRFVGCNAHASTDAREGGGDEMVFRALVAPVLTGDMQEFMVHMFRHLGEGLTAGQRAKLFAGMLAGGSKRAKETIETTCEVAQMIASRLGLGPSLVTALGYAFENFNGKGLPRGASGDEIPLAARIGIVARDVEVFHRIGGWEVVSEILMKRRGKAYDPSVTDAFLAHGLRFLQRIDTEPAWEVVIAQDPSSSPWISGDKLKAAFLCFADFSDLKCTFTRGHSRAVAELSATAMSSMSLAEAEDVSSAAMVQELGKTGISNGILDKPAALTPGEFERVRLHPYLSERILARCSSLSDVAALASAHHERLDGSGYHRGSRAPQIPMGARVLAAAEAFAAMTKERPWRPPLSADEASAQLVLEVRGGRLDHDAVDAVLSAAGQRASRSRTSWPAGLSDREVEVLRLISTGKSNRQVAGQLVISPKTVGRHIENIYAKACVSTRAAAALFASENGLLS